MAFLFDVERVQYQCSCESRFPLCRLYFCRYCIALRCANCTQHEADVFFCPQCLQSHMAPEAKLYHMKCKTCFECPSCSCVMSLRSVTSTGEEGTATKSTADGSSPAATKKKYYLTCGYCHWSTRDSGFEEKELTALHESFFDADPASIKQLKEAYQLINFRDASEKVVKKAVSQAGPRRKNLAALALKDDTSQALFAMKLAQHNPTLSSLSRAKQMASVSTSDVLRDVMAVASSEVEPLSDSYFTDPVNLAEVSSVSQRLNDIAVQPTKVKDFKPNRKRLAIKKSIRCKSCDHSLCKPEFSTSNIKFKIQLLAQLQLLEVRIQPGYKLELGKACRVVLSISNPDQLSPSTFKLIPDNENKLSTCSIETPESVTFELDPKNDAFSLDDSIDTDPDKEQYISFNRGSKIGIICTVNVPENLDSNAMVCVVLHHTPILTSAERQVDEMQFPVAVDLGAVKTSES